MQENTTQQNSRKRRFSSDNSVSTSEPEIDSTKKHKNIETLDRIECQRAIQDIFSRQLLQQDTTEVVIDHKGDESLDELIHLLFESPSGSVVDKVKEKLCNPERRVGTTTIENVVVVSGERASGAIISNSNSGSELSSVAEKANLKPEQQCKLLIEKLKHVEGFETEDWAENVRIANVPFFPSGDVSQKEKNECVHSLFSDEETHFDNGGGTECVQAKMSSVSELDDRMSCDSDVHVSEEGKKLPFVTSTATNNSPDYFHKTVQNYNFNENESPGAIITLPEEPDVSIIPGSSFEYDTFSDINLNKLPDEAITPNFVLEYVLSSGDASSAEGSEKYIQDQELPMACPIEVQNIKSCSLSQNIADNEMMSVTDTSLESVGVGGDKGYIETDNSVLQTDSIIPSCSNNSLVKNPAILCGDHSGIDTMASPITTVNSSDVSGSSNYKSTAKQSSIKSCKVVLTRFDESLNDSDFPDVGSKKSTTIKIKERLAKKIKDTIDAWKQQQANKRESKTLELEGPEKVSVCAATMNPRDCITTTTEEYKAADELLCYEQTEVLQNENPDLQLVVGSDLIPPEEMLTEELKVAETEQTDKQNDNIKLEADQDMIRPEEILIKEIKAPETRKTKKRKQADSIVTTISAPVSKKISSISTKKLSQAKLEGLMREEMTKEAPNVEFLSEVMEKTYSRRQKELQNPLLELNKLLKLYPALKLYSIVKEEYGRILQDMQKLVRLEDKLGLHFDVALNFKKRRPGSFGKRHRLWQDASKKWTSNPDCDPVTKKVLGMLALSFHLAENCVVTNLCKFKKDGTVDATKVVTPTLVLDESHIYDLNADFWIYVDGEKFLKVPNFYEGVLSVYATYYLFNIEYDRKLKDLFHFFDWLAGNKQPTYPEDFEGDV